MKQKVINIVRADSVGDYRLRLSFDDETEQAVDFQPFLSQSSQTDIRAWLSPTTDRSFPSQVFYGANDERQAY